MAGTNTNLTVDPTSIGVFFSDKDNSLTSSVSDDAKMTVTLINPIAMNDGLKFAIREGGRTVGAGVVTKIIE